MHVLCLPVLLANWLVIRLVRTRAFVRLARELAGDPPGSALQGQWLRLFVSLVNWLTRCLVCIAVAVATHLAQVSE